MKNKLSICSTLFVALILFSSIFTFLGCVEVNRPEPVAPLADKADNDPIIEIGPISLNPETVKFLDALPEEVKFAEKDGEIVLGVQYSPSNGSLNFTFTIDGRSMGLEGGVQNISTSFYKISPIRRFTNWASLHSSASPVYMPGPYSSTFAISDIEELEPFKNSWDNIFLSFRIDPKDDSGDFEFNHYVSFEGLCSEFPGKFLNLDNGKTGCDFMDESIED